MNKYDGDIKLMLKRESASAQLTAFLMAAAFGVFSGAAALCTRETVLGILRRAILSAELEVNQYGGFTNMTEIVVSAVLVGMWLILTLAAWHVIGKKDGGISRLRICGIWCAFAAAAWALFRIIGAII